MNLYHPFSSNKKRTIYYKKITNIQIITISLLFSCLLSKASEIKKEERKRPNQNKITEQRIKNPVSLMSSADIHKILHAPDTETLKKIIKQEERSEFLKQLCEKQKQFSRIPWSCYELYPLDNTYDPFCLKLKLKDLEIDSIKQAISLKTLGTACRKHLGFQLKILNYRKSKREEIEHYKINRKKNF